MKPSRGTRGGVRLPLSHVAERLRREGIRPRIAYTPDGIPKELI
ncbi:MAG: hypothetical protein QXE79_05970 [Candidatus Bathyarchaeia archaeon]